MKGTLAVFGNVGDRRVAAFLRDGQVEDLLVDPPQDRIRPGAIYRARVGRLLKGLGGALLDTPDGPVFLRNAKGVGEGQTRLVQAVSYAEPGKATPVTTKIVFKSRYCLVTPGAPGLNLSRVIRDEERRVELRALLDGLQTDDVGIVVRSAAASADDEAVLKDVRETLELSTSVIAEGEQGQPELLLDGPDAEALAWREWDAPDATSTEAEDFEHFAIPDAIEAALQPFEALSADANLYVEQTRALVAVDVNTGGDNSPAVGIKANLAAAAALPGALRRRGLAGQVVIDFAPMPKRERRALETTLRRAFKDDPIETSLVGWTTLGLFELQRKRERISLSEAMKGLNL